MVPFYGWGSTVLRLEPLRGDSLLFTIKFPKIPVTVMRILKNFKWVFCKCYIITSHDIVDATIPAITIANVL